MEIKNLADLFIADANYIRNHPRSATRVDDRYQFFMPVTLFSLLTGQAIATIYENSPIPPEVVFEFPSITLRQMNDWNLLPKSMYPANSLPALAFTNVKLRVDAGLRQITVTGDGSTDRLDLGIASLPISGGTIHLQLYVPETGTPENLAAFLEGSLQLGQGVSVKLTLPRGFMDWYLSLQPGAVAKLNGGLADLAALTGMQIGTLLPEDLASVSGDSGFTLSELTVRFGSQINAISLSIKTPGWNIIRAEGNEPPRLAVQQVTIRLNFEFYGRSTVSGGIVAQFNVFGVDVDVVLPIPFDSSNWHLESHPNVLIPGLGDIVAEMGRIVGAGDLSLSMPPGLSDFGSLIVQYLKISFDPTTRAISDVSFRLSSANAWTLPYVNTVSLEEIYVNLSIANPLVADKRQVTGVVTGKISLGRFYVPVEVERLTAGSGWALKIVYDDISVGLPDLLPLIGIKSDDFKQALPESLSIVNDIAVSGLSLIYDFNAGKVSHSSFQLELSEVWRVIPDYLEINSLNVFVEIDHPSDSTEPYVLAAMDTEIEIGDVGFDLTASNYNPTTDWALVLKMREGDTINFKDLIGALMTPLLPAGYKLPPEFPTVVCKEVALAVVPATKAFQARLTSDVTWSLPFAKTSFYFDNLRFDLSIGESPVPPATGTRPYTFAASGGFVISTGFEDNALDFGKATITTTNTGADTVLTIRGIKAVNLPGVAQELTTGRHTDGETWNSMIPAVPVEFATELGTLTLDLLVNLTQNVFAMHGSSPKYGSIAFLTKKINDKDWGYCVAAKLANGFTFASLLPELSVIDGVMTFKNGSAGIAYSSFDAKEVKAAVESVPQFSEALTVGGSEPIAQGVNFYAAINFATATNGVLFGNVVTLLSGLENKPDLVVYGHIAKRADDKTNNSLKARFTAKLGDFRVLNALDFHGVTFQYAKDSHTEITLTGDLKLTLDKGKSNEQVYPFHGDLKVTNTRADFALRTPNGQSIVNPLGMTGVTIRDLHLIFSHVYSTKTTPVGTTVQLGGKANFGTATQFDANLYVANGTPLLVEVSLTQQPPLGIIALLASSVAGVTYPADYFDIKFMSGSAYYYKKADDTQKQFASVKTENNQAIERHDGFNLQTTLKMFDRTVALQVNVQPRGVTASGKMLEPFDLDFIEFTDADFTGSPSLFLRVLQNEKAFGLKAGVKLFKERFATGELSIGKYSNAGNEEAHIKGHIAYAGNIELFAGSALSFTYSKSAGFKITDWPLKFDYPLEYAKLMNGFKKGGCSA
ncbi:MAG TPA: hypothetical protein PLK30_22245, partial [Blastocatellia bacterium]|nr:hypothetical protein [Blastocatellia bacterium]